MWLRWILRLIGPFLLLLFLMTSDMEQLIALLLHAHAFPVIVSLLFIFPFLIIKSWRWQRILSDLGIALPMPTATALYTVGVYLASVTPGQSGDLMKAWYLRNRGHQMAPALLSVVLDRLCDLVVMAFLATLGVVALGQFLPVEGMQPVLIVLAGLGFATLTIALVARRPRAWLLTQLLPRIVPARFHPALERWNSQFTTLAMRPRLLIAVGLASLASALFTFFRLWLLFTAVNVQIPFLIFIGISALIAVLQILPISIAGVGVRDAVLIAILTAPPYLYRQEQALGVSALFLLLTLEQIVVGFLVSLWYPMVKE